MEVAAAMSPAYATASTHKSLPGLGKVGIPAIQFRSSFNPTRLIGSPLSDPGSIFLSHLQSSRIISAAAAAREDPPQPLLPDSKDAFVQSKRLISAAAGREDKSSIMDDEYERANEIEKANAALEMSLMSWTENKRKFNGLLRFYMEKALKVFGKSVRGEEVVHRGLWTLCENCKKMLYIKFLRQNKRICEECGYHMRMGSSERIELLLDQGTWRPLDEAMVAKDVLKFYDKDSYANRLSFYQKGSGLTDAIQTGIGRLKGTPVALGVMDFQFMGGSMGSVVGEKVTRLIEHATKESMPVIIVSSSGGARMQEGTLSLMQMAKISSALNVHQKEKKLLYIVILTNPTTGGVTASFGMLGDINIAEPKAYVAFAGKRVIEETSRNKISSSKGFQTAEAVFDAGLIDLIVPRNLMRGLLGEIIELYSAAPYKAKQAC